MVDNDHKKHIDIRNYIKNKGDLWTEVEHVMDPLFLRVPTRFGLCVWPGSQQGEEGEIFSASESEAGPGDSADGCDAASGHAKSC